MRELVSSLSRITPSFALLCVTLVVLAAGVAATTAALTVPWLDMRLRAAADGSVMATRDGERVTLVALASAGDPQRRIDPRATDLVEEPDVLGSFAEIDAVLERQEQLAEILRQPVVRVTLRRADGLSYVTDIAPSVRPLADLPATFWVQLVTGIGGLLIGGWVWSLRRDDWAARLFALSGAGLMISALPAAVYGTRQLAIDADTFRALMALNHLGSQVFGGAVIGLFLSYPVSLVRRRRLWLVAVPIAAVVLVDLARIATPPFYYLSILLEMTAIVLLIGVQWFRTRREPAARAALAWLGLSVVLGAGSWTVIAAAPILIDGAAAVPQGYSFGLFLLIYVGLALGVSRYRLFELGDWSLRILFFTLGTLLLLAIDAALVLALQIDKAPALGLSLLLIGFLYLPLRDELWRLFTRGRRLADHELFAAVMEVAFAPTAALRAERWRALIRRLFDPLEVDPLGEASREPALASDGLRLELPAAAGSPALRLGYPWAGRGLFGPSHLSLARHLVELVNQAEASREAYERGVTEERRRMAQDLHDDVGARLLSGLHIADERTRPILHAAMADIRSIVTGLVGDRAPLDRVLADIRHECARRLESTNCTLHWPPLPDDDAPVLLDYRLQKALTSSVREIVTNVIRHAGARQLAVAVERDAQRLVLTLSDDGVGLREPALAGAAPGQGLRGVARRMQDVAGQFSVQSPGQGTTIRLEFPLNRGWQPTPAG